MAEAIEALKSLNTVLVDSLHGYEEALEDAGRGGLAPIFADMIALRQRHIAEMNAKLKATGETVENNGSYRSIIHRTIIGLRAAVVGLDYSVLPSFIGSERRIVQAYDVSISKAPQFASFIQSQRNEVMDVIGELEGFKTAA
jgi:uncharacterized protein (TIGR02284 family)